MTIRDDEAILSLDQLLARLEQAVQAGDRAEATRIERTILQRLLADARARENVERRTRELMAQLDAPDVILEEGVQVQQIEFRRDSVVAKSALDAELGSAPAPAGAVIYPVWFGTNRKPDADDGFTGERHGRITRGRVDVRVPKAHRFGETGAPWWKRLIRLEWRDDRLRIQHTEPQKIELFYAEIHDAMQAARDSGATPHALVFVHGFRVSFEDAAIRAAQLGCDLKVPGATAFFSWPSRGRVEAYAVDEASIEASEAAITDFLVEFAANCQADKVHVIAHSMGNRGLLRALQRIAGNAATRGKVKFGQIFLAAPDVDRDLFRDLARLYPEHAERATLYASHADWAVHISSKVHDAPRAGYFTPYTVAPGIDTIAVPNFDVDLLGHSYYAQAEALLYDIRDLMRHNENPKDRQRVEAATDGGIDFWSLRR